MPNYGIRSHVSLDYFKNKIKKQSTCGNPASMSLSCMFWLKQFWKQYFSGFQCIPVLIICGGHHVPETRMPGTKKGVHIIACSYIVQGPKALPGHMWPPLPVNFFVWHRYQVPGTSGKPSLTGKMTVGFSCMMNNHVKTNGHLWLLLGHAGMMQYTHAGHAFPMWEIFSHLSEKVRNFFSHKGEGEKNFLT